MGNKLVYEFKKKFSLFDENNVGFFLYSDQ